MFAKGYIMKVDIQKFGPSQSREAGKGVFAKSMEPSEAEAEIKVSIP